MIYTQLNEHTFAYELSNNPDFSHIGAKNMKTELKTLIEKEFTIGAEEKTELIEEIDGLNFDWFDYINIDGWEYRVIPENLIEGIFEDSCIVLFDDCFLPDVPDNLKCYIDYDKFIRDCSFYWYGQHFSGYDGSEIEGEGLYLFRNN